MASRADEILAPRWSEGAVRATSSTAATLDLRLVGPQTATANKNVGAQQRYVRIYAYTTDCCVVFADTSAHADDVTFLTAAVNAVSFGVPIVAGTYQDFVCPSDYYWLGYITASAAGSLVVYINSRPE